MARLPEYRIILHSPRGLGALGCVGCLLAIFVVGGVVGVLLFGWKTLLGF
jgi:hypothetical protein